MKMFRTLRADEIDCRIAQIKGNGLTLLLYKDARCDQNILDETVGAFGWQRSHTRDNANCIVSLWDAEKQMWVSKEDVGTESNTEAAKGLASDSFKRACFNWGIGRELYSAPFIWVPADKCNITGGETRPRCYDKFTVQSIKYREDGARDICELVIFNASKRCVAFKWIDTEPRYTEPEHEPGEEEVKKAAEASGSPDPVKRIKDFCLAHSISFKDMGDYRATAIEKGIIPDVSSSKLKDVDLERLFAYVEMMSNAGKA